MQRIKTYAWNIELISQEFQGLNNFGHIEDLKSTKVDKIRTALEFEWTYSLIAQPKSAISFNAPPTPNQ